MSLMDILVSVGAVSKGYQDASRKERQLKSEEEFKKEDIATRRESTEATRELTRERLGHELNLQKMREEATEKITRMTLGSEEAMNSLRIQAQQLMVDKQIASSEGISKDRNLTDIEIANIRAALEREGFKIRKDELLKNMSLGQMQLIIKAFEIIQSQTRGMSGLYEGWAVTGMPGWAAIRNDMEIEAVDRILQAIGVNKSLGIPKISEVITTTTKEGSRTFRGSELGAPTSTITPTPTPAPTQSIPSASSIPGFTEPTPSLKRTWWGGLSESTPQPLPRSGSLVTDRTAFIPQEELSDDERMMLRSLAMETKAAQPENLEGMVSEFNNWMDNQQVTIPWLTSGNRQGAKKYYNFLLGR